MRLWSDSHFSLGETHPTHITTPTSWGNDFRRIRTFVSTLRGLHLKPLDYEAIFGFSACLFYMRTLPSETGKPCFVLDDSCRDRTDITRLRGGTPIPIRGKSHKRGSVLF